MVQMLLSMLVITPGVLQVQFMLKILIHQAVVLRVLEDSSGQAEHTTNKKQPRYWLFFYTI